MRSFIRILAMACMLTSLFTAAAETPGRWVGSWAAAPLSAPNKADFLTSATTVRNTIHLSIGGSAIRLIVSNEFGTEPLTIGGASVAVSAGAGALQPGTSQTATFSGHASIVIPPGALVVTDPITLAVKPLSDLAVDLYLPAQTMSTLTQHSLSLEDNYAAPGNQLGHATLDQPHQLGEWFFLKGVDVLAGPHAATVVAFGDSITDGYGSTSGKDNRWPDVLAARLQNDHKFAHLGVIDEGISGNRILHDNWGPSALARFDRDVLSQDGVKYLIILEGINDIGHAAFAVTPNENVTADDLIAAMEQMIDRAHMHGIKVIGATLTPYEGAKYYSAGGEATREALNKFIRTSGKFDGVIDFDKMMSDPAHPLRFVPSQEHGGHLHPNDAGYTIMGNGISLDLFAK